MRPRIFSTKRGEASAARAYGDPPALLTRMSSRPCSATMPSTSAATASGSRTSHCTWVVPGAGCSTAERAQVTTVAPASTSTAAMPAPMPWLPPVTRATRPVRSTESVTGVEYQANAWLSDLRRIHGLSHPRSGDDGVRVVTMDYPPVNALPVQGWFDLAAALDEAEPRPGHPRRGAARRGQGLQRRRRHQGDAAHRGLRRPDRRQPRLLRRLPCGLRVQRARDRRGQGLLRRRRRRAGRQRRLHRRQRRRLLRHPRGRPRRPGRGHPPGPDGPAAPDAHALLHRPQHHGRRPGPARLGARGGPARRARRGRARRRSRDRRARTPG